MEGFKANGWDSDYERNVRFISYQAQLDAPSVTMRKLKKENLSKPVFQENEDVILRNGEEGHLISARGLLKFSYMEMVTEKNPKAIQFMNEYYKLLAMRKYGKTAAAIRQEVNRMAKDQALKWIEKTQERYIHDDTEIMNIMKLLT
ncbi:hypothetical protein D3C74_185390 [compost metagenome]